MSPAFPLPLLVRDDPPALAESVVARVWRDALTRVYGANGPISETQAYPFVALFDIPITGVALESGYLDATPADDVYRVFLLRTSAQRLLYCCLPTLLSSIDLHACQRVHMRGVLDPGHLLPLLVARRCLQVW